MNFSEKDAAYLARSTEFDHLSEVLWSVSGTGTNGHESKEAGETVVDLLLTRLEQEPENIAYIKLLGFVFAKAGYLGASIVCYTRAIALAPLELESYKSKAAVLELLLAEKNMTARSSGLLHSSNDKDMQQFSDAAAATVIILCAGDTTGWSGFESIQHRPLIDIDGQLLLKRTLSQIKQHKPSEIIVAVKQGESRVFKPVCGNGVKVVELEPRRKAWETPAWKYLSTCFYWGAHGRTVCLLGDVGFSDSAIKRIFTFPGDEWMAYGKSQASRFAGHPYPNVFGLSFTDSKQHEKNLVLLDRLYRAKICATPDGGWALSKLMRNEDPNSRTLGNNLEEIDDFMDHFETAEDLRRWLERYPAAQG